MARFWRIPNHGRRFGDLPSNPRPQYVGSLVPCEHICVRVCSFTFYFETKDEINEYITFFEKKVHPSSRLPIPEGMDRFARWHAQRWYERLPLYLQEEAKRERVLKALKKAIELVEAGKL
jgi:hypothetical protein